MEIIFQKRNQISFNQNRNIFAFYVVILRRVSPFIFNSFNVITANELFGFTFNTLAHYWDP